MEAQGWAVVRESSNGLHGSDWGRLGPHVTRDCKNTQQADAIEVCVSPACRPLSV